MIPIAKPKLLFVFLMILASINSATAQGSNDCEQLAKEFQKVYGGDLVLVQPLKDNGAYDLGKYNGHWINQIYLKGIGIVFYDPVDKNLYSQGKIETVKRDFEQKWNKRVEVLNYNKGEIQFAIYWHY